MPLAAYGVSSQTSLFDVETAKKRCAKKKSTKDIKDANDATGLALHALNHYKRPDCDNFVNKGFIKEGRNGWGFLSDPTTQDFYPNKSGGKN